MDESIEIGWISHTRIPLTEQAERYPAEVQTVIVDYEIDLLGSL